ncbi:sensor histidine kinase [Micromonospora sp. LH3U1]|uniref:sensor histidine kinase n=1 Tax=Micromonospora sp. LH3U1 TaxID=3018339 RepID=UPI00234AEA0E|nr:histidine kinase [Micromonospora sp. LH3U1]WCN79330.1 histidine kinase [Micromonospora sp. LH3U1]
MRDHTGTEPGSPRLTRWIDGRLTRLGVLGVFSRDCLLAAVLTVLTFALLTVLLWFVAPEDGVSFDPTRAWLLVAICCAQAMLLCLRRVRPLLCLALVVGLQLPVLGLSLPEATIRGIAPFVVAYTVGSLLPLRRALLAVGAAVLVESIGAAVLVTPDLLTAVAYVSASALTYLGATFVGSYVATYRRYVELVRVRAEEAIREQRTKVQAAIGAERSRMARELHDVAAHHLSGMVVQAAAVERLIDRDPAAAKAGVTWIRTQGKETLDNLRLIVGVLRGRPGHEGGDGAAPVPGLGMLDDLVRTAGNLGGPVELVREGQQREVSPIADVALYRIAQESLSNVRQHAPGAPVRVVLRFLPRSVSLEVVNEPAAPQPAPAARTGGVGLVGMRERAQLIGATFTAGPTAVGGWSVTATLPTNDPVASHPKGETPA